jgi:hypothetical protein
MDLESKVSANPGSGEKQRHFANPVPARAPAAT